jgi:hypothetical protein
MAYSQRSKPLPPRPVDPRSRRVVKVEYAGNIHVLSLECGHSIFRKYLTIPSAAICDRCPNAGGIGGNAFERRA